MLQFHSKYLNCYREFVTNDYTSLSLIFPRNLTSLQKVSLITCPLLVETECSHFSLVYVHIRSGLTWAPCRRRCRRTCPSWVRGRTWGTLPPRSRRPRSTRPWSRRGWICNWWMSIPFLYSVNLVVVSNHNSGFRYCQLWYCEKNINEKIITNYLWRANYGFNFEE